MGMLAIRISCCFLLTSVALAQVPIAVSGPAVVRQGVIVNEALAQVGDQVLTQREVVLSYLVEQILNQPENFQAKKQRDRQDWLLKTDSEEFKKHFAQFAIETVVQLEADAFAVGAVTAKEMSDLLERIKTAVKGWDEWDRFDYLDADLTLVLQRKIRAKKYLKFKMESAGVVVTDAEAKAYYERNKVRFGNAPFEDFKESIKEVLSQEQLQAKLKDWFEVLKKKYRFRRLGTG